MKKNGCFVSDIWNKTIFCEWHIKEKGCFVSEEWRKKDVL